jgi:hypothetical protein
MSHQEIRSTDKPDENVIKKTYVSPCLKSYGAIHLTTQATGASNGDGGPTMMA